MTQFIDLQYTAHLQAEPPTNGQPQAPHHAKCGAAQDGY